MRKVTKEVAQELNEAIKLYDIAHGLGDKAIDELLKASKCLEKCESPSLCPGLEKCKDMHKDRCKDEYEDKWEDKHKMLL